MLKILHIGNSFFLALDAYGTFTLFGSAYDTHEDAQAVLDAYAKAYASGSLPFGT